MADLRVRIDFDDLQQQILQLQQQMEAGGSITPPPPVTPSPPPTMGASTVDFQPVLPTPVAGVAPPPVIHFQQPANTMSEMNISPPLAVAGPLFGGIRGVASLAGQGISATAVGANNFIQDSRNPNDVLDPMTGQYGLENSFSRAYLGSALSGTWLGEKTGLFGSKKPEWMTDQEFQDSFKEMRRGRFGKEFRRSILDAGVESAAWAVGDAELYGFGGMILSPIAHGVKDQFLEEGDLADEYEDYFKSKKIGKRGSRLGKREKREMAERFADVDTTMFWKNSYELGDMFEKMTDLGMTDDIDMSTKQIEGYILKVKESTKKFAELFKMTREQVLEIEAQFHDAGIRDMDTALSSVQAAAKFRDVNAREVLPSALRYAQYAKQTGHDSLEFAQDMLAMEDMYQMRRDHGQLRSPLTNQQLATQTIQGADRYAQSDMGLLSVVGAFSRNEEGDLVYDFTKPGNINEGKRRLMNMSGPERLAFTDDIRYALETEDPEVKRQMLEYGAKNLHEHIKSAYKLSDYAAWGVTRRVLQPHGLGREHAAAIYDSITGKTAPDDYEALQKMFEVGTTGQFEYEGVSRKNLEQFNKITGSDSKQILEVGSLLGDTQRAQIEKMKVSASEALRELSKDEDLSQDAAVGRVGELASQIEEEAIDSGLFSEDFAKKISQAITKEGIIEARKPRLIQRTAGGDVIEADGAAKRLKSFANKLKNAEEGVLKDSAVSAREHFYGKIKHGAISADKAVSKTFHDDFWGFDRAKGKALVEKMESNDEIAEAVTMMVEYNQTVQGSRGEERGYNLRKIADKIREAHSGDKNWTKKMEGKLAGEVIAEEFGDTLKSSFKSRFRLGFEFDVDKKSAARITDMAPVKRLLEDDLKGSRFYEKYVEGFGKEKADQIFDELRGLKDIEGDIPVEELSTLFDLTGVDIGDVKAANIHQILGKIDDKVEGKDEAQENRVISTNMKDAIDNLSEVMTKTNRVLEGVQGHLEKEKEGGATIAHPIGGRR